MVVGRSSPIHLIFGTVGQRRRGWNEGVKCSLQAVVQGGSHLLFANLEDEVNTGAAAELDNFIDHRLLSLRYCL